MKKYKLLTREIIDSDIGAECPFMPEEGEYEIYLTALAEDINNLNVVLNSNIEGNSIVIELEVESDFEELHDQVKLILQSEISTKLKNLGFRIME
jgi:hypothetical protein